MQLGQKIGVSRFYKYLEAFGLTEKTNADLASESNPDCLPYGVWAPYGKGN